MPGYSLVHQDQVDPPPQSPLHKLLSAHMMAVEHAMNADLQQTVRTPMLKSFAPKVFQSKLMKSANFSHVFPGHHPWEAGA
jgi:hypothetical protein